MTPATDLRAARHPACVVCSPTCGHGLRVRFALDDHDGAVGHFDCAPAFEGYPGLLHGGVTSALLDGAMTDWLFLHGATAVTAELNVRFRHPVALGEPATLRAWLQAQRGGVYRLEAELLQGEQRRATATATFMRRRSEGQG